MDHRPAFDREGEIQAAEQALVPAGGSALLAAAYTTHAWLDQGGTRAAICAALIRFWTGQNLLRTPLPLTGPRALGAGMPFEVEAWVPALLDALADEAACRFVRASCSRGEG